MSVLPTEIARTDNGLEIKWSDHCVTRYTARQLRDACPCATCREKRRDGNEDEEHESDDKPSVKPPPMLPVLTAQETQPMEVRKMRPVGNYAYSIAFSDGHSSGLYTFDFLRGLAAPQDG